MIKNPSANAVDIRKRVKVKVMSDSLQLHGLYSPWNALGQNSGVGSLPLLNGIFLTQGSNPGRSPALQVDSLPTELWGNRGSIPGSGRSPGEGNGNPLQYSFLENLTDRRAWWTTVHRIAKGRKQLKQLSTYIYCISSLHFSILKRA